MFAAQPPGLLRTILVIAALLPWASPGAAQLDWVGLAAGTIQSRFEGPATVDFTTRRGWSLGVFAEVATPLSPVRVRVEGRWIRRGGDESTGGGGAERDLFGMPLVVGPRWSTGPVSVFPFIGAELAYPLATRRSADIEVGFENAASIEFSGLAGASLDVVLPGEVRAGLEVIFLRGLSSAFDGRGGSLDLRASGLTLRVARPLG